MLSQTLIDNHKSISKAFTRQDEVDYASSYDCIECFVAAIHIEEMQQDLNVVISHNARMEAHNSIVLKKQKQQQNNALRLPMSYDAYSLQQNIE